MIRVTLEMVSARGADRDRLLGVAYIANEGPVVTDVANPVPLDDCAAYRIWLSKTIDERRTREKWLEGRAAIASKEMEDAISAEVPAFDHVRRGAWDLLYLALKAVVGRRNQ